MHVANTHAVGEGIRAFYVPQIDLTKGLGLTFIGQPQMFVDYFNPLNLVLFTPISSELFLVFKAILFIFLLQFGTYKLIGTHTNAQVIPILASLFICFIPTFHGLQFGLPFFYLMCSVPAILFLINKIMASKSTKYLLAYLALLMCLGLDVIGVLSLLILVYSHLLARYFLDYAKIFKPYSYFRIGIATIIPNLGFGISFLDSLLENKRFEIYNSIPDGKEYNFTKYWRFILNNGLDSSVTGLEGSAIQLYLPTFIYVLVGFSVFYSFSKKRDRLHSVYIFTSICVGVLPSLIYAVPFFQGVFPSALRHHLNFLPILFFLHFFVFFTNVIRINPRLLIAGIFLGISLEALFLSLRGGTLDPAPILSSNRIDIPFLSSIPWSNLLICNIVLAILVFTILKKRHLFIKSYILIPLISFSAFFSLFYFSVLGEIHRYSQVATINDYRIRMFNERIDHFQKSSNLLDKSYRILPSGRSDQDRPYAMDVKLLPDLELSYTHGFNSIFQYREIDHGYIKAVYKQFGCNRCEPRSGLGYAYMPPTSSQVIERKDLLKLLAIKYVESGDQEILDPAFKLITSYRYKKTTFSNNPRETGTVYLYQYLDAEPIFKIFKTEGNTSNERSINQIRDYQDDKLVLSQKDKIEGKPQMYLASDEPFDYKLNHDNANSIQLAINGDLKESFLLIKYLKRDGWYAKVDSKNTKVYEAQGGMMAIKLPANARTVSMIYRDSSLYLGNLTEFLVYFLLGIIFIISRFKSSAVQIVRKIFSKTKL